MTTNRMGLTEKKCRLSDENLRDLRKFLQDSYTGSLDTLRYAYAAEALDELLACREASKEPMMYTVTFEGQVEEIGGDCQSFKREDCQQYIEWLCDEDNQEGYEVVPLFAAPPIQAVTVPDEMTPEMMRAVQLKSELGAYAASNLSGAYDLFAEFWSVACLEAKKRHK